MSLSYSLQHLIAVALVAGGGSAVGVHLLAQEGDEPKPTGALIRHYPSSAHQAKTSRSSKDAHLPRQDEGALDTQDLTAHPHDAALTNDALNEASAELLPSEEPRREEVLDDSEQGQSLSDSLSRLEAEYKAMLARTDRIEGELLAMKVDRLEQELKRANAQAAEQQAAAATQEAVAVARDRASERTQQVSSQELWQNDLNQAGRVSAPAQTAAYAAQTTSYSEPENSTTITQSNQMVVYNYVPIVVNPGHIPSEQTDKHNQGKTANTSTRSLHQLSMQHQRAIRSPLSTQSTALGTPLSPWAPIDMSKHHNPWSSSHLP